MKQKSNFLPSAKLLSSILISLIIFLGLICVYYESSYGLPSANDNEAGVINDDVDFQEYIPKSIPKIWNFRVTEYWKQMQAVIQKNSFRNIMDMKSNLGGFAAGLEAIVVWVMNVAPVNDSNKLKIIYDRGLLRTVHDWELSEALGDGGQANTPPRGWNSYDSFSWTISEAEFLQNAEVLSQRLKVHGYQYAVLDYLWYRRKVQGAHPDSLGFDVIDKWGRMMPDPDRWPSSRDGKGLAEIAMKVHSMGLRFGIHVMRGISTQAVNANTPILDISTGVAYTESGKQWYAKDIALIDRACKWMPHGFMSVNTNLGAGKAFLRSLHSQYADWGVDFVKHDCVFGDDYNIDEITFVSGLLTGYGRPILYSLSPGVGATPEMAKNVSPLTNLYRVTGDDWDKWGDVVSHFDVSRDFSVANMIGAKGLQGNSWPDLDMLPIGWLTDPASNQGPYRASRLTLAEQKTLMTLWSIAKSPLMFGGDLRKLDNTTYDIISNPILLEINSFSKNNMEFPHITASDEARSWIATGEKGEIYLAFFNLSPQEMTISTMLLDVDKAIPGRNLTQKHCVFDDGWTQKAYEVVDGRVTAAAVASHGCALLVLRCSRLFNFVSV